MIVGDEQEAALQQVLPQPRHFRVGEVSRARVFHEDEGALEELVVGQAHDDGVGHFLFSVLVGRLDADLGQLGEPGAEVEIGAGVIGGPALLLAPIAREHDAAEMKTAFECLRRREFRRRTAVVAAPEALGVDRSDAGASDGEDASQGPASTAGRRFSCG